jgi:transcriptional regulator with GAF, ATPase, and Fis domain
MLRTSDGFEGIIGHSSKMQSLFELIDRVADDRESTVLIHGESGTGKELVARAIHNRGPRQSHHFVPVNCAAIPEDLLESELFGYLKGAFTGAVQNKIGRIQYAAGGTLFLDEIGDMKPSLQAKLLRVIQEKEFEPVGGVKPISVDVRIVAATHRDLEQLVAAGKFREDLFYRLSVVPLNLPPLRERCEDIALLIGTFTKAFNRGRKLTLNGFSEDALEALHSYPWPGNVRELENLVQRLVILHGGAMISSDDLPTKYVAHLHSGPAQPAAVTEGCTEAAAADHLWSNDRINFNEIVDGLERQLINQALARAGGNKKEAAKLLSLKRTTLIEKIKKKEMEFDRPFPQLSCA